MKDKDEMTNKMDDSEESKSQSRGPKRRPKGPIRKKNLDSISEIKAEKKAGSKAEAKVIAVHTLTDNETWSHLALRYYGNMSEPYWRYMYEFNKELVGDNYKAIWGGMEIRIPELPDDMKKEK